jgi:hypothetical protein
MKVDNCVFNRGRLRRQLKRVTEVRDMVTNEVVGEYVYKKEALKMAKKHVGKTGHKTYGIAKFVVKKEEDAITFKVDMTEYLNGKLRDYIVVVYEQIGNIRARGNWHENTTK